MTISRPEVLDEDRWNVENMYSTPALWKKEFDIFSTAPWTALNAYRGKLSEGPQQIRTALDLSMSLDRKLSALYTYAHLRHDEDITNPEFKSYYELIMQVAHAFAQETAWFQPELLSIPEEILNKYIQDPILEPYRFHLEKIMRLKKNTLSAEKEHLIALAGQALQAAHKTFRALNDADFKFGSVQDSSGNDRPLTHATFGLYVRDQDRILRERAFNQYHGKYSEFENSLCELLSGQAQNHLFNAKARHFDNCLEAALYPKNIDTSIYHALISAVNDKITVLHKYMKLRKKILGVDQLHLYDMYVPLTKDVDIKMNYSEAEDLVISSVKPLGDEYQEHLKKGLRTDRWVDRFENLNKRSGAYSSGCYDSMPYILMNYKGVIRDVFTLAHEVGHSMHSFYSHRCQPYQYGDYPIFLAEVASTFNEDLLARKLLGECKDTKTKIFLINQKIEDIRATLFRQTMFAEFELLIHQKIEQGIPLTPQLLREEYKALNAKYFGPDVFIDEAIEIEWARIPHFYYNFYVFQYATGISAALALAERVMTGGDKETKEYLSFLKSGSSRYPLETLKLAGIDMASPEPVKAAIDTFGRLVDELDRLVNGTGNVA